MEALEGCQMCCASHMGGLGTSTEAMLVEETSPYPGSTDVPVDAEISIRFSEIPDVSSVTPGTVRFSPKISWAVREGDAPGEIVIVPNQPLASGTTYTVKVDGVVSLESEPVFPYVFSFTTA